MIDPQLLESLEALQRGETLERSAIDNLVVHSLAVSNNGTTTLSWVGRIALESYRAGRGVGIVAA